MEDLLNFVKQNCNPNDIIEFCNVNNIDINIQNENGSTGKNQSLSFILIFN